MTVSEILNMIVGEYGTRYQVTQTRALALLNQIQSIAFNKDLDALMVSDAFQTVTTGSKGPYSFPTAPPVRKFIGVSTYAQNVVLGLGTPEIVIDYGLVVQGYPVDTRALYTPIVIDHFGKTYTFVSEPSDTADTYRLVYYRSAPTILSSTDDRDLLIPQEFHHTLCVQGAIALADFSLQGKKTPQEALEMYLEPFWDSMRARKDGNDSAWISEGSVGIL